MVGKGLGALATHPPRGPRRRPGDHPLQSASFGGHCHDPIFATLRPYERRSDEYTRDATDRKGITFRRSRASGNHRQIGPRPLARPARGLEARGDRAVDRPPLPQRGGDPRYVPVQGPGRASRPRYPRRGHCRRQREQRRVSGHRDRDGRTGRRGERPRLWERAHGGYRRRPRPIRRDGGCRR